MIDLRATSKEVGERILKRLQRNGSEELARFEAVLKEERKQIRRRREVAGCDTAPDGAGPEGAPPPDLAGLALSGGGLRSATFCLGFLQALNDRGSLKLFDYLSTVSGGGFIGGWWSAWLTRKQAGDPVFPGGEAIEPARQEEYIAGVAADMGGPQVRRGPAAPTDLAPPIDPLHHLRLFSNYLTPRKGLLSADTWRAIAVVSRNLGLTWMVLLPLLLAATLLAQVSFLATPRAAYGFACATSPATPAKPDICLSMSDNMPTSLKDSVLGREYPGVLRDRLVRASEPLLIVAGWIAAAALAWLLVGSANLQNMLGTMLALIIVGTALYSASDRIGLGTPAQASGGTGNRVGIAVAVGSMVILLFWWLAPTWRDREFLLGQSHQDQREALTNRATRLQSTLLVVLAGLAVVLGLGGFGHDVSSYLFTTREGSPLGDALRRAGGWGALLITVGGAVATAVYASPAGGGEKDRQKPRVPFALLLAVTPVLVICVLAIGAATLAHWLLVHLGTYGGVPSSISLRLPWVVLAIAGLLWVRRETKDVGGGRLDQGIRVAGVVLLTVAAALAAQVFMRIRPSLDPLDAALLLSVLVCGLLTAFEYVEDASRSSRARRLAIVLLAGGAALLLTGLLRPALLETLQRVHDGRLDVAPAGMRRAAGAFVGLVIGFTIARHLVAWTPRRDKPAVLMMRHRTAVGDPEGTWIWVDLALSAALGGMVGWIVSWMRISGDALPVDYHRWTIGSPALAGLCLLGLMFSSIFVLLDLVLSREESRRALALQLIVVFLLGITLMQQFLNPYGASVVLASAAIGWIGISLGLVAGLGWLIDPNTLSLHAFYRARLVRAYLGATNQGRRNRGERVTESVRGDDLPLYRLANCESGGPYHLINATLNLVGGRDLATAQRLAAGFVLSQGYCGSLRTGFRPTSRYMHGKLSLGTALATSGAAASPTMGSKTPSAALAMLLAFLNIRLGFWAPTPNQSRWRSPQARLWPYYLLRESLSQTNDLSAYCYLTDGGHFDNTGLYSLVERGCRYIVLLDCGADPKPCFADLGEAVRRCRIDFDAEITLDVDNFVRMKKGIAKAERPHYVVGKILYAKEHLQRLGWGDVSLLARQGIVIWVKPSLRSGDPADVRQYALENAEFPQQSTADQWFGESQFESYRRLGEECGNDVLGATRPDPACTAGQVSKVFKEIEQAFELRLAQGKQPAARPPA